MECFSRRFFLGGCASFGALAGRRMFAAPKATLPKVNLKFCVVSDVHVRDDKDHDDKAFKQALTYFRDNGADAVLIAGDIADQGRISQLKYAADAWYAIFPDDKAPDGRHVEKLFVYGNHDVLAWKWGRKEAELKDPALIAEAIGYSPETIAATWEKCFREKYDLDQGCERVQVHRQALGAQRQVGGVRCGARRRTEGIAPVLLHTA